MTHVSKKLCVLFRKAGIAKLMFLNRNMHDFRRPGRPGKQQMQEETASGMECFFGRVKKMAGKHFNDFGLHFEVHFRVHLEEKT